MRSPQAPSCLDARSFGEETSPGSHRFYGGVTVTVANKCDRCISENDRAKVLGDFFNVDSSLFIK